MKYANQVNVMLAVIGAVVVAYTFWVTFLSTPPGGNLDFGSTSLASAPGHPSSEAAPAVLSETTSRRPAVEALRSQRTQRSTAANSRPVWRGPIGGATGGAVRGPSASRPTSNLPVWNGPNPNDAIPGSGGHRGTNDFPQPSVARSGGSVQRPPSRSSAGNPSHSSASSAGRDFDQSGPPPGAESAKRGPDPNAPPPPVRSSMPENRPPM